MTGLTHEEAIAVLESNSMEEDGCEFAISGDARKDNEGYIVRLPRLQGQK